MKPIRNQLVVLDVLFKKLVEDLNEAHVQPFVACGGATLFIAGCCNIKKDKLEVFTTEVMGIVEKYHDKSCPGCQHTVH